MRWFPAQDLSLWIPAALPFGSPLAAAWLWPPNPSSLRVTGCIYAPLRTFTVCRATNVPASVTFSTSGPNIITAHLTCNILLYFNVGCLFWIIQFGRYNEYLFQVHGLTGLLMLESTPWILFAIYFLPKINSNFIPKEVKWRILCIFSSLYRVWCQLTIDKTWHFYFVQGYQQRGQGTNWIPKLSPSVLSCWW